eukprot:TRINITY_DN11055_c0_g1_i1.p1 TRINITY_DN11055_c0_g1~~TRINITY_DN11055_c0_g1_i1.p1  ORF type:complete len:217 (+),score=34.83 TRINITY_DN11055_c0_g1_i1:92-742(+)
MGSSSGQGCCCCFSLRTGTVLAGISTILSNLFFMLPCIYALIKPEFWAEGYKLIENWVLGNHWDSDVTSVALRGLGYVSEHNGILLMILIALSSFHIFNSLILILGALLHRPLLFLPWMIQDALLLALGAVLFVLWAFLSFFVDVLVAVLFPILAGLVLGYWIYLWKNIYTLYGQLRYEALLDPLGRATIYTKLPAGSASSASSTNGGSRRMSKRV